MAVSVAALCAFKFFVCDITVPIQWNLFFLDEMAGVGRVFDSFPRALKQTADFVGR